MSAVEPERVVAVILEAATQLFEAEGCSLALLDDVRQQLAFVVMAGPAQVDEFRVALGQGIGGWVAQTGEGVVCNDVAQDARFFGGDRSPARGIRHAPFCARHSSNTTRSLVSSGAQHGQARRVQRRRPGVSDDPGRAGWHGTGAHAGLRQGAQRWRRSAGSASWNAIAWCSSTAPAMQEPLRIARTVAATNTTVLLLGESGTGKEVVARAIHQWSATRRAALHCHQLRGPHARSVGQ